MKKTKMNRLTLNKGKGMAETMKGFLGRNICIWGRKWLKIKMRGG